jgi:hypothetical protein
MQIAIDPLRPPHALQQQVVEHEREIERRIPIPRALGVEEDRTLRPGQDVLRADIAMHEREIRPHQPAGQRVEPRHQVRMHAAGRDQVRLRADRKEDVIGGEALRDVVAARRRRMDPCELPADRLGGPRLDGAVAELRLPHRIALRRQVFHHEPAGRLVLEQDARHRLRRDVPDHPQPFRLAVVALDRRAPVGFHLEPGQRLLDAVALAFELDQPEV